MEEAGVWLAEAWVGEGDLTGPSLFQLQLMSMKV